MKIKVEKPYQSPCSPPTDVVYLVKISDIQDDESCFENVMLLNSLEERLINGLNEKIQKEDNRFNELKYILECSGIKVLPNMKSPVEIYFDEVGNTELASIITFTFHYNNNKVSVEGEFLRYIVRKNHKNVAFYDISVSGNKTTIYFSSW